MSSRRSVPVSDLAQTRLLTDARSRSKQTQNAVRIVGVDALPGLFVLGKLNLYLLDGLARTDTGEVVEAADLEQDVFSVPGTIAHVDSEEKTNHQWRYDDIIESSKRMFLFREVG